MVRVDFDEHFKRIVSKLEEAMRQRIAKLLNKIKENPEIGKPMKHGRKGTRELYLSPFRLSYAYDRNNDVVVILDLYHKDEQ